jgi:hypothetical protein
MHLRYRVELIPFAYPSAFTAEMIAGIASSSAIFQFLIAGTEVQPMHRGSKLNN